MMLCSRLLHLFASLLLLCILHSQIPNEGAFIHVFPFLLSEGLMRLKLWLKSGPLRFKLFNFIKQSIIWQNHQLKNKGIWLHMIISQNVSDVFSKLQLLLVFLSSLVMVRTSVPVWCFSLIRQHSSQREHNPTGRYLLYEVVEVLSLKKSLLSPVAL